MTINTKDADGKLIYAGTFSPEIDQELLSVINNGIITEVIDTKANKVIIVIKAELKNVDAYITKVEQ